jgi:DNA replication licensing factor MCM2
MPALDRYDAENMDDEDYDALSVDARRDAEREMRRRDREQGILHRDDRDILYDESDDDSTVGDRRAKRRRMAEKAAAGIDSVSTEEVVESIDNLSDSKGHSLKEWVSMLGPRTEIANRY